MCNREPGGRKQDEAQNFSTGASFRTRKQNKVVVVFKEALYVIATDCSSM